MSLLFAYTYGMERFYRAPRRASVGVCPLVALLFAVPLFVAFAQSAAAEKAVSLGGFEWVVKESASPVGPGPNYFSARSVSDAGPAVVLRVVSRRAFLAERRYAAEIYTRDFFGYGTFELDFRMDGPLDSFLVFGFFLYNNDSPPHFGEVDFELARWGIPDADDGQFSVQPWDAEGNSTTFRLAPGPLECTALIDWRRDRVELSLVARDGTELSRWSYAGESMPLMGGSDERARVHVNLWPFRGMEGANDGARTVEVTGFRYARAE